MMVVISLFGGSSSVQLEHLVKVLSFNPAFILLNEVMKRGQRERHNVIKVDGSLMRQKVHIQQRTKKQETLNAKTWPF